MLNMLSTYQHHIKYYLTYQKEIHRYTQCLPVHLSVVLFGWASSSSLKTPASICHTPHTEPWCQCFGYAAPMV